MQTFRKSNRRKSGWGFTLLEIMITLAIMVIVMGLGITSMSGYLPKQRLIATAQLIESMLQRAQSEAYSRSSQVGVHFVLNAGTGLADMNVFIDSDLDELQGVGEGPLTTLSFRTEVFFNTTNCEGVNFSNGTINVNCDFVSTGDCMVMFNSSGQAIDPTSDAVVTNIPATGDYELFIHSKQLSPGVERNREIEALSSGMIAVIKGGQPGNSAGGNSATTCQEP